MNLLESMRVALEGIMAGKLRSFLTTLGIVIGIAAVIAVMAIGQGGRAVLMAEMEKMGSNMFAVYVDWRSDRQITGREFQLNDERKNWVTNVSIGSTPFLVVGIVAKTESVLGYSGIPSAYMPHSGLADHVRHTSADAGRKRRQ